MRQGVLVTVHISRWRAVAQLTPEHLGLTFGDEGEREALTKSMRLGEVYLLPDRYIKAVGSLDSLIRKNIQKWAFHTYYGEMLTAEAFQEWKEEHDRMSAQYLAIGQELFDNWQSIVFEVADLHMANARAAYRREKASGVSKVTREFTEDEFVRNYVDAILQAMPGGRAVMDSFGVQVDYTYIPLPDMINREYERQAQISENERVLRAKSEAEIAMHREVMQSYKSRYDEQVVDNLKRIVTQLNDALYQAASDILATSGAAGRLHPRSVVQLKNAVGKVRSMNFLDYADIDRMCSQAESLLEGPAEGRSFEQAAGKLRDIVTVTRSTLMSLQAPIERSKRGAAQVVEVATAEKVREARGRLGLVEVAEIEAAPQVRGRR
jgi:hypothetical protein